jgi:hypothetical protein
MKWGGYLILTTLTAHASSTLINVENSREHAQVEKKDQHVQEEVHHNKLEKRLFPLIPLLASVAVPLVSDLVGRLFAPKEPEQPAQPAEPQSSANGNYDDEDDYDDDEYDDDEDFDDHQGRRYYGRDDDYQGRDSYDEEDDYGEY